MPEVWIERDDGRLIARHHDQKKPTDVPAVSLKLTYHFSVLLIGDNPLPLLVHRAGSGIYKAGWAGDESDAQRREVLALMLKEGVHVYREKE